MILRLDQDEIVDSGAIVDPLSHPEINFRVDCTVASQSN